MARDRVNPIKWERPSEGGTENDEVPSELDHSEDYINTRGIAFQSAVSNDEVVIAERDTEGNMVLQDGVVVGPRKLTDLLAAYHGIESAGALSFDNSTHVVTIAAGVNAYWYKGNRYATANAITCDLDSYVTLTANTLYYVYFDDVSGTLKANAGLWNLKEKVPVAMVFWSGSAGAIYKETHNHTRDIDWHLWAHTTVGARYGTGLSQTYPSIATDASLQIELGTIYDEDLSISIAQQTVMRGWYQASAGVYTFSDYALPYLGASGDPKYLNTGTYALTSVLDAQFVCYWVYATSDVNRPIAIIPTHAASAYVNIGLARDEQAPNLAGFNLNPEWKLIYRFIYRGDGQYQEGNDYRLSSPLPSGGVATVTAAGVGFVPSGSIVASNVQAAIEELDSESYKTESNGESSTNSTDWVQKLRLTFTAKLAGTFCIMYSALVVGSAANKYLRTRIQVDDTITKKESVEYLAYSYSSGYWASHGGCFTADLTAAEHNIDIDFCVAGTQTPTMYIKEVVLMAVRFPS